MSEGLKGIIGTVTPILGVITSLQEQILWHLRMASLVIGITVGLVTLVSMVRKWRRDR